MYTNNIIGLVLGIFLLGNDCNGDEDYNKLSQEISQLIRINQKLQERLSVQEKVLSRIKPECLVNENSSPQKSYDKSDLRELDFADSRDYGKSKRLLMSPTSTPTIESPEIYPAFFAYLSHLETTISPHHTLIFDSVKTNIHGGYNKFTGTFTVPVSGVYVLTWSIRGDGGQSFELVGNGDVLDSGYLSGTNIQIGKTYVGSFQTGDAVYLRTHKDYNGTGRIYSNTHGYSVLAGFRIKQ